MSGTLPDEPTFTPDMPASPLRERVRSSAYGQRTASPPKRATERTWEEAPTFKPELNTNPQIKSSGYGKVIPAKSPAKETPEPEFKLSLPKSELRSKVASSSYGKVVAKVERPQKGPEGPFKPQLPPSQLRSKVASSAYGKVPAKFERPQTAPAQTETGDFRLDCVATASSNRYRRLSDRYTLLKDHGDADPQLVRSARSVSPIRGDTQHAKTMRERVASSNYGKVTAQSPNPAARYQEFEEPLPPKKTPLADKIASSGYGKVSPAQAPRPEHKSELGWSPVRRHAEVLPPPPEVPQSPTRFHQVPSSGYGHVSPAKAERPDVYLSPVWAPALRIDPPGNPEPVRSHLYDYVQSSGYGSTYVPAGPGNNSFQVDEVGENGDHAPDEHDDE